MRNKPEILSPAGDPDKLRYAVAYGADAVYLAGKQYGMRTSSDNFTPDEISLAVAYCHARCVKVFVTVNSMPRQQELAGLPSYLELLGRLGVDGIIAADLGVISLARRFAPQVPLHISTQASVVNAQAACLYHQLGAKRVVLARELSLSEIQSIRANTPQDLELEVFVHGAMCMAYSGRCILSNFLTGRDANRGNCAQPCRWSYQLLEEKRPGQLLTVEQDGQGTYLFNSKDLCMIDHLTDLMDAGVDSLKIEGRVKSEYYAAVITGAYRRAVDWYWENPGQPLPSGLADEVNKVSHREYGTGFYYDGAATEHTQDSRYIRDWDVCAVVEGKAGQFTRLSQRNKFSPGDSVELIMPGKEAIPFCIGPLYNEEGQAIETAPHPKMTVLTRLPEPAPAFSLIRKKNIQS